MYALSKAYLCYYVFANANKQINYNLSIDINVMAVFVMDKVLAYK